MEAVIEAQGLNRSYGRFQAVRDVSFQVNKGQIIGLLGPNGAGKTTLMKILTAYHNPSSGTARINGHDVVQDTLEAQASVGYLPEMAPLYADLNVVEYLSFMGAARGLPKNRISQALERSLELCALTQVRKKEISHLSKGFRQRVGLAQAIIHEPEILILDEPTTGLDPHQILEFRNLIRTIGQEKTVILSTHILQEVEALCEGVMIMNEGRILAEGKVEDLARNLRGEVVYTLEVLHRGLEPAKVDWKSLDGPSSEPRLIRSLEGDRSLWELTFPMDAQGGERLFDWAVARGLKLLSLSPKVISLEEVFINLTKER